MLPFLVPVDSHTATRVPVPPPEPVPEAGARWGEPSAFKIEDPADNQDGDGGESPDDEDARRGGLTIVWPQEHIYTVQTRDMTPVWRSYDVVEIEAEDDPAVKIEVAVTRQMLFPIRTETLQYVGGGSYVIDTGRGPFEERIVHSYLLLEMPGPPAGTKVVRAGLTEGEWPPYREEMFIPGRYS